MSLDETRRIVARKLEEMVKKTQPTQARVMAVNGDNVLVNPDDENTSIGGGGGREYVKNTGPYQLHQDDKITVQRGRSPLGKFIAGFHYSDADGTTYPRLRADYMDAPGGTMDLSAGTTHLSIATGSASFTVGGSSYDIADIGDGTDPNAIHDNASAEISAITEKTAPVAADLLLIEDSAASNAKKRVKAKNLPGQGIVTNHIINGSFNHLAADFISSLPLGWGFVSTPSLAVSSDVPTAAAINHQTTSILRSLEVTGDLNEGIFQTIFDGNPGQVYTLSGYVKASSGTWKVYVTGNVVSDATLTGTDASWTYFETQFTLDGAPAETYVELLCGANSSVILFDEVMLARGDVRSRSFRPHKNDHTPVAELQQISGTTYRYTNMNMQSGKFSEASNPTTITFGSGYIQAPVVVATVVGATTDRFVTVESVSTTQFVAQVRDAGGSDQDETVHWIAIGPVSTPS